MPSIKTFPLVDNLHFGGDQSWFQDAKKKAGGCGVVAAANVVLYYLGRFSPNKSTFLQAMNSLYYVLNPLHFFNPFIKENTLGLPFFNRVIHRTAIYLRSIGVDKAYKTMSKTSFDQMKHFIMEAIDSKDPVILFILFHKKLKYYNNHYMTITGYQDTPGFLLEISTWGSKVHLTLEEIYDGSLFLNLGTFYDKSLLY